MKTWQWVVAQISGGVVGDERKMPFYTKQFGVCFNEHTLEHLTDLASVRQAVSECVRVADYAIFLVPHPWAPSNFYYPTHWLQIKFTDDQRILVRPNKAHLPKWMRFDPMGLGDASASPADAKTLSIEQGPQTKQMMVVSEMPPVLAWS